MAKKLTAEQKQKQYILLAKKYLLWYKENVDTDGNVIQPMKTKPPPPIPILP